MIMFPLLLSIVVLGLLSWHVLHSRHVLLILWLLLTLRIVGRSSGNQAPRAFGCLVKPEDWASGRCYRLARCRARRVVGIQIERLIAGTARQKAEG
jgi:hypothetical protein